MTKKENAPLLTGRDVHHSFENTRNYNTADAVTQFQDAISATGLPLPSSIIPDKKIHRFATNNRSSDTAGWYVLHVDGIPAGAFGDWRTDLDERWCMNIGRELSATEQIAMEKRAALIRRQRDEALAERQKEAKERATLRWEQSTVAEANHLYLTNKNVGAHGIRCYGSDLIVPLRIGDVLHSLQTIRADGSKRFFPGGRKKGCYHLIGDPGEVLCVAEGYATAASIHEATGHAVAVAFDAGNLQPVGIELASRYPDIQLVFCADDDRATEGNPGLSKAKRAGETTGGLVVVPSFPAETSGTDFNDLHQACGAVAVRVAIDAALAWPAPESISGALERERYPIEVLPPVIRDAVEEVQSFVQAPLPMIATSAFGALSLAVQGLADIKRADTLTGPTSLSTLTIADSGERKSTVDKYFTGAVRAYEKEQRKELQPKVKAQTIELDVWKAKRQGLLRKITSETRQGNPTDEIEDQLAKLEREKPPPIKVPYLIRSDETSEHLAIALRDEWPSGGIISSEAGIVFGSHAMNPESIMRNLSQFNVLWDGGELQTGRVTRKSFQLRDVRLTVSLQIQPAALKEFLDKHGALARGNGFLARFLISWPESTQGSRPMADPPDGWPRLSDFNLRVRQLLNAGLQFTREGGINTFMLGFNPEAQREWRKCHDEVESQIKPGKPLHEIKDAASKVADNVARMATLMHVFQYGPNGAVGPESVTAAFQIVSWHINETHRFLGEFSLPPEFSNAALLDDWLCARCRSEGTGEIAKREVLQYGPNPVRRKRELDEALKLLEERHRVRLVKVGKRQMIQLNPGLLSSA